MERCAFYEIPENTQRLFTTAEVGAILNQKPNCVSAVVRLCGIQRILKSTRTGRSYFFNYAQMREIKNYYDRIEKKRKEKGLPVQKAEDAAIKYTLEELKQMHPLVTDIRCFKLSWWPETTPKCFEDLGD